MVNGIAFCYVPIAPLVAEEEGEMSIKELFRNKMFWMFMVCAGASELGVSQWASTFAERGLSMSKAVGDLGCSSGPSVIGFVSSHFGDNLHRGILVGTIFPLLLFLGLMVKVGWGRIHSKNKSDNLYESKVRGWQSLEMAYKICYDDKQTERACT